MGTTPRNASIKSLTEMELPGLILMVARSREIHVDREYSSCSYFSADCNNHSTCLC